MKTKKIHCFAPIAEEDARILILGTLPSAASLEVGYNYGHPRNAFWYIMQTLLLNDKKVIDSAVKNNDISSLISIDPTRLLPIETRKQLLVENKIALWDSLHSAARPGSSLDSAIDLTTEIPNDIPGFLLDHKNVRAVFFNGSKSESVFIKLVAPAMDSNEVLLDEIRRRPVSFRRLPSTSPANAGISMTEKLIAWSEILDYLL